MFLFETKCIALPHSMALHETIPQITHVVGFLLNIQMHETIPKHSM